MSGVGRGRGWLNIKREQQAPGGIMTTTTANKEDPIQKYLGYIDNITEIPVKYSKVFHEFETVSDTNILIKKFAEYQYTEDDICECISLLVQTYLLQWNMSFEVIANAYKFNRRALLNSAQNIHENGEYLFKKNKQAFVKFMIMLTRCYYLMEGSQLTIMALIQSSKIILEPVHTDSIRIFTRCLHQVVNADFPVVSFGQNYFITILKHKYTLDPDTFCIFSGLRAAICSTNDAKTRYWLYLALDILGNGLKLLPEDTLAFYAIHLGQTEINYFRQAPDYEQPLYLDTNQSLHSLEQYVSGVSVLKIDDSPLSLERQNDANQRSGASVNVSNTDHMNLATSNHQHRTTHKNSQPRPLTPDNLIQQQNLPIQQHNTQPTYQQPIQSGGAGRAILGSGARNNRTNNGQALKHSPRYEQPEVNGWREEQPQHSAGPPQQFSGLSRPPPPDVSRNHSAWNHDDRC